MPIDGRVLRFWYETEVLTMPRVPALSERLAERPGDEPTSRVLAAGEQPPWPVEPVEDERGRRWVAHHYVHLGLFRQDDAAAELLRLLGAGPDDPDRAEAELPADTERWSAAGCLAAFAVDHLGAPEARTFALASMPWALGRLRAGAPLRGFPNAGREAAAAFAVRWRPAVVADEEEPPDVCLTAADLAAEVEHVTRGIGWEPARRSRWIAVVGRTWRLETTEASDEGLVNSFYLDDLERVRAAAEKSRVGPALETFLSPPGTIERTDVWRGDAALASAGPASAPVARWPAPGLPPQSLMQQAGIDLALERLGRGSGLFSINGPPGTGKTTLLRDVIAALVAERARRLAELERPEDAFEAGERVSVGGRAKPSWRVRADLLGFEMVVASSINGAVENVTREIPGIETVDASLLEGLDYFRDVASSLAPDGSAAWGLVAAVLGNLRNRRRFAAGAWFQDPTLRAAMASEDGPSWEEARAAFLAALAREREHRERAVAAAADPAAAAALLARPEEEQQRAAPWITPEHDRCRAEVFVAAMGLHRAFAAARPLRDNLALAIDLVTGRLDPGTNVAGRQMARHLWSSFFLVVPVVSTTFASFARLFRGLGPEALGWLFIDEAGQAQPAHAVGALWRSRRALVIGDPRQIPPVVTLPRTVYERLRSRSEVDVSWDPTVSSVQGIADRANPIGTELRDGTWLGCPLRLHRRCASPMFDISNAIAYDGLMVSATPERPSAVGDVLGPTRWIDVAGGAATEHWIEAEGEALATLLDPLLRDAFVHGRRPDIFVISPFRSVAVRARRLFRQRARDLAGGRPPPAVAEWLERGIGTIHTFQGKEAEAVALLLGGNPARPRARQWAGETPNILNVAVTRARLRLYVIGSRAAWRGAGFFAELDRRL
jgi:AAA domain